MEVSLVSNSTKRNWSRLGIDGKSRLLKCANKRFSLKNIIPLEYFKNIDNLSFLSLILNVAQENNIKRVIYSLALNLLNINGLIYLKKDGSYECSNEYLSDILKDFSCEVELKLLFASLPNDEFDFLGIVYQSLLKEGSKNINGSYYTPKKVLDRIVNCINSTDKFLDPCCGTGSFLLAACEKISNPENLYGVDKDEIACFISKINLIIKFKGIAFQPKIFNIDFLSGEIFEQGTFDIIATNPPWGAKNKEFYAQSYPQISSGESFSYFIVKSRFLLAKNGKAFFVLPQSVLNVKIHQDIRKFILNSFHIDNIYMLGRAFSGVLSNVVILDLNVKNSGNDVKIYSRNKCFEVSQNVYNDNEYYNFSILSNRDNEILEKIYSRDYETLKNSKFALGIVTGNNAKFILDSEQEGYEKIYTGKEVGSYFLNPAKKYIKYEREKFQQVAREEIYRADEKLVYKFISSNPVFAYDDTASLFLNSANILIPRMKYHSVKTVLAYLNSTLFKYIYLKKFNELKILKSHLQRLPFPILAQKDIEILEGLVEKYFNLKFDYILEEIDDFIYLSFGFDKEEISYIKLNCN